MSNFNLTPLVPVSGPSPFLGNPCEANDPAWTFNLEFEPYVAVDPTNLNHLVGAWIQDANRGIVAGVSFNGGNTWQSIVIPGTTLCSGGIYPQSADPWVSFTPNGDVYLSSLGFGFGTNPNAVLVSKSTDGGLTWGAPTTIVTGTTEFNDKESITADPTNSKFVYAAWSRKGAHPTSANTGTTMFSRTTDGGQTWEPAREIFAPGPHNIAEFFQIVVLPDGTLVNVFAQQIHKNNAEGIPHYDVKLSLIRSSDHGQTWQFADAPIPVADIFPLDDTVPYQGVPNPDGGLGILAVGVTFDVAIDPANGNLYAVWQDARFSSYQYNSIAFSMSMDAGFTWSAPIQVNQTPNNIPVGNRQAFLPSVAVNQDGVVAVTYYDLRNNTADSGLPTDYWMVHAHPADGLTNPASWSSENRLTPESFNMEVPAPNPNGFFVGDYEGLVAEGKSFGAFWAMPPIGGGINDQDSVFFRDPLPAESGAVIGSRDPGQPPAPGGNSAPSSLVSFASGTLPLFATIEVGTAPMMGNSGSWSEAARPSTLLSAVTSWLPTPEGGFGSGRNLQHAPCQRVSTDWDDSPVADAFVTDLIALDIVAPLTGG